MAGINKFLPFSFGYTKHFVSLRQKSSNILNFQSFTVSINTALSNNYNYIKQTIENEKTFNFSHRIDDGASAFAQVKYP